ncbi:hypothetical protein AGMMS50225_20770 [Betaproteobacteria bacterium]|nr:hypothetical protein AGMMS50225_20770 [Betaproteobacteria bacterium]
MAMFEDSRTVYGEHSMVCVGLLAAGVVVIVHVECNEDENCIISTRKAEHDETGICYRNVGYR